MSFLAVDEQNAQTTKQVEEAVAQITLNKSSESMSSFSRTSSSITDIEEKDSGNEKCLTEDISSRGISSSVHTGLGTIDESFSKVERRKSASQGSQYLYFHLFYFLLSYCSVLLSFFHSYLLWLLLQVSSHQIWISIVVLRSPIFVVEYFSILNIFLMLPFAKGL